MKKTLIKNIDKLITVSSNSELKKGPSMKDLTHIKNAWIKVKDDRILDFGSMEDWKGVDDWNEFDIIDAETDFLKEYYYWILIFLFILKVMSNLGQVTSLVFGIIRSKY